MRILETVDLDCARTVYRATRGVWLASNILDAYERLSLVTVAAGIRQFSFLCHVRPKTRTSLSALISNLGLHSATHNARFDLKLAAPGVSGGSALAYSSFKARSERFLGIGVWSRSARRCATRNITLANLGLLLQYPGCCVQMDISTKQKDHESTLRELAREVGDDPNQITHALRRRIPIEKRGIPEVRRWAQRYQLTLARYPFALHTACDACLKSQSSPTADLSRRYEDLVSNVSDELHFLIRWAAHVGCGGIDEKG
jgi:hypothetical protein